MMPEQIIEPMPEAVTVTPGEARNGWTSQRLAVYLQERAAQQLAYAANLRDKREVKSESVRSFRPFDW